MKRANPLGSSIGLEVFQDHLPYHQAPGGLRPAWTRVMIGHRSIVHNCAQSACMECRMD